jgi:hypothetical protein
VRGKAMQEVLHVRYKTDSIFYPKPADGEFPIGNADLKGKSPREAYLETLETGMMNDRPLVGAWLLWVETDGHQWVLRWGDTPFRDRPENEPLG